MNTIDFIYDLATEGPERELTNGFLHALRRAKSGTDVQAFFDNLKDAPYDITEKEAEEIYKNRVAIAAAVPGQRY